MDEPDDFLVERAQRGDAAAFEELVRRTSRLVFARLYLETGNSHQAEDLMQETLLTAYRTLKQLTQPDKFRSWLLKIAQNLAIDAARHETRKKRTPSAEIIKLRQDAFAIKRPDEHVEQEEQRQQVLAILRGLPEEYRLPLTLRYLVGADYESIQAQMGLSNGSLRGLLHRGMQRMRVELRRANGEMVPDNEVEQLAEIAMSDHNWTFENLSAFLAGGLTAKERQRVETHVAACAECAQALGESRELERLMDGLFTNTRPDADMETRALVKLRQSRMRRASIIRFVAAAAAVLVFGLVGAAVQAIAFADMWMPGEPRTLSQNKLRMASIHADERDAQAAFSVIDGDPASREIDADIAFKTDKIEKASVAGAVNPNEALGIIEDRKEAAFNLSAPRGFSVGQGSELAGKTINGRSGATGERTLRDGASVYGFGLAPEKNEGDGKHKLFMKLAKEDEFSWDGSARKIQESSSDQKPEMPNLGFGLARNGDGESSLSPKSGYFSIAKNKPSKPGDEAPDGGKPAAKMSPPERTVTKFTTAGSKIGVPAGAVAPKPPAPPADTGLKIIRTGEMEFEVDSFDRAAKKIAELIDVRNAKAKGSLVAFASKEKSDKLQNGKKRGYIVVRIQPEFLDKFIEDLRNELDKFGDLKTQHVSSQDVTMQYTDTESELKAARAVETSLLKIIETKKGDIKDLVAAEATLGTWRTTIEKLEGQMRVLRNQIGLSTLTITLTEKDIGTPASLVVNEKVTMRVEVDDVKKAVDGAVQLVREFKGRILKSEIEQHKAGQFEAILHAEVPPAQKEAFGKRIGELGIVSENKSTQKTQSEGGTGKPGNLAPRVNDVVFEIALNNIVNIQPRRSVTLLVATADVPAGYKKLKDELVQIAKAQLRTDNLNEQDKLRITAHLEFNVPTDKKEAVDEILAKLGKILKKTSAQAAITEIATDQKFGYNLNLIGPASIPPRETVTLKIEVKDVDKRFAELKEAVHAGKGRVADADVVRHENGQVTAKLVFDVPLAVQDLIVLKVKDAGNLLGQQATRDPNVPENEFATAQIVVHLSGVFAGKQPREKVTMNVEVSDVDQKAADLKDKVRAGKGRVADEKSSRQPNGQVHATLVFEVPFAEQDKLVKEFKDLGKVVSYQTARNASVPENDLATAQITLTLGAPNPIVGNDEGLGWFARKSLSVSFNIFAYCILAIIAGLSFLLPAGAFTYAAFKAIRWMWPGESAANAVKKPVNGGEKPA